VKDRLVEVAAAAEKGILRPFVRKVIPFERAMEAFAEEREDGGEGGVGEVGEYVVMVNL